MPTQGATARRNVEIGQFSYYSPDVRFMTWIPDEKIIIGKYCSIASDVIIYTGGNHRTDFAATYPFDNLFLGRPNPTRIYRTTRNTTIANDVWIGCRAVVTGGVHVGNGAVIGTGAVVFSDVPDFAIVAGNPAQVVRYRFSRPTVERLLKIAWWDWPEQEVRRNIEWFYRPIQEFVEHFDPSGSSENHG